MRWDLINALLHWTRQQRYLEVGVQQGRCAAKVRATTKWGVDPAPHPNARRHYHPLTQAKSDDFFATLNPTHRFDVIFIDGLHHAEQVVRDVDNALSFIADDGFIVLHDCNPQSEVAQRVPRVVGQWNGDVWRAVVELRQRPDIDTFVIDVDEGLGVVRKRPNRNLLAAPGELTYATLAARREELLDLVCTERWAERIGPPLALGRVVVVSAIFGGRDVPTSVPAHSDVDEFVLFTDEPVVAPGWTVRHVPSRGDPRMQARRIKTTALELVEADVVLWVDGRIRVTDWPLRPLLRKALQHHDIAGYPHPWRDCVYAEAADCIELERAPRAAMQQQCDAYQREGLPAHVGLWNTMVLARRDTAAMREFGRLWLAEIENRTHRDQVSLPYLLWKHGVKCAELGDDVYYQLENDHFKRGKHASGAP